MGKKVILVLLSITPLPQKQSYLKDKPLKKRFGIIALFYYRTQSLCILDICLKFCLKMFVMLHIPEALRQTVMPWTPTWVNQEKISTFV